MTISYSVLCLRICSHDESEREDRRLQLRGRPPGAGDRERSEQGRRAHVPGRVGVAARPRRQTDRRRLGRGGEGAVFGGRNELGFPGGNHLHRHVAFA